ncbi:hypothetical protein RSWS8N_15719 [Cereibacter sphaeroides WS8N]|uniref:hypothetical protein n=1 Tax=Cereibacter sphaeroides TaxID=1063 RepID=UPI00020B00B1|nr:hypothetical protein [Cereibacter sphaeroides]EGJ19622.1 hypothetical protein RSWS8N_15719 [Cereibacter sphaeroides WS8N]
MARSPINPRISLNKLAEFMTATPARQRRIIRDQKFPPAYQVVYYREAQEAVSSALASELSNLAVVERQIDILNQQAPDSVGTQRRLAANVDALEAFMEMVDRISFGGARPRLGENDAPKLRMRNVDISVRPEIILVAEGRSGPLVGAMKVHFPKTNPLDDRTAGYVSALLQEWATANLHEEGQVSGLFCSVIDIGSRCHHEGVRATRQRLRDLEEACETIHALWPTISDDRT